MQSISYSLTVDGATISDALLDSIREIEVEDHAELADMMRLKVAVAVEQDGAAWTVADEALFERLTPLRLTVTVGNTSTALLEAYVIQTKTELSASPGGSMLEVIAMDPTCLMNLEEKVKSWPDMADSDIASTIFGEYGYEAVVDQTQPTRQETTRTVIQRHTDIRFLRELAQRNGYECYVELNPDTGAVEGHFHAPRLNTAIQGVLSVNLGTATNVNRFSCTYNMVSPVEALVNDIGIENQSDESAEITAQSLTDLGKARTTAADRPRRILPSNTGLCDAGELQTYAQAMVNRSAFALRAEGEVSTVTYGGILRAKRTVNVRGAGQQMSGTYYVEKVLHRIGNDGYTQTFSLRRNASGVTGQESFVEDNALASS